MLHSRMHNGDILQEDCMENQRSGFKIEVVVDNQNVDRKVTDRLVFLKQVVQIDNVHYPFLGPQE